MNEPRYQGEMELKEARKVLGITNEGIEVLIESGELHETGRVGYVGGKRRWVRMLFKHEIARLMSQCWYPKGVGFDIFGECGECPYCLMQTVEAKGKEQGRTDEKATNKVR
ncbi:hypothetical protein LCGC14_2993920 [marine sediment metagenome]|uniref:Uncharacterized protein n=1 Tax=marine sediment metagenome TaxID=412755 RepID=A0A0F8X3G9_9ZZZZ